MSPREKGRRECTVAVTWPAVSGRVITFWVFPERKTSSTSRKSREGGLQFLVKRNKLHIYVFMYVCIFPFSHWTPSNNKTSWFHKEMKCSIWVPLVGVTIAGTVNVCRS